MFFINVVYFRRYSKHSDDCLWWLMWDWLTLFVYGIEYQIVYVFGNCSWRRQCTISWTAQYLDVTCFSVVKVNFWVCVCECVCVFQVCECARVVCSFAIIETMEELTFGLTTIKCNRFSFSGSSIIEMRKRTPSKILKCVCAKISVPFLYVDIDIRLTYL